MKERTNLRFSISNSGKPTRAFPLRKSSASIDFISEYDSGEAKAANEILEASWFSPEDAVLRIKNEPTLYRLKWLLENNDKVRHASYSKNPFKIISETNFNNKLWK